MRMKLLPAMLFVIALFFGALVFLQTRGPISRATGLRGIRGPVQKKTKRLLTVVLLFCVFLLLLKIMGKIALLIVGILFLISLLAFKKT